MVGSKHSIQFKTNKLSCKPLQLKQELKWYLNSYVPVVLVVVGVGVVEIILLMMVDWIHGMNST